MIQSTTEELRTETQEAGITPLVKSPKKIDVSLLVARNQLGCAFSSCGVWTHE